jgi:hypothetical protein
VLNALFRDAGAGKSLGLIGLAGTGKSNLLTYAQEPAVIQSYFSQPGEAARIFVCQVRCKKFADSLAGFYPEMLNALRPAAQQVGYALPVPAEKAGYPEVCAAIQHLCRSARLRVIVFMDEFEMLIRTQPLHFFEELRNLRDEVRETDRFAYVFVTHRLPHRVVNQHKYMFESSSLYRLICNNLYTFGPYTRRDAVVMLQALLGARGLILDRQTENRLLDLSGGHAGILTALVTAAAQEKPGASLLRLGTEPGPVREACAYVWEHLHSTERRALQDLTRNRQPPLWMCEFLYKRGLVAHDRPAEFFSPIFYQFVRTQGAP